MRSKKLYVTMISLVMIGLILSACAQPAPVVVEKQVPVEVERIREVVVEKEVPVEVEKQIIIEKSVVETVVVEREVVVEKEVQVTVEVEKQVVVEKEVQVTVAPEKILPEVVVPQGRYGGTFVIASNEPPHLNEALEFVGHPPRGNIFSSLLKYNVPDMSPRPDLARWWEISEDGLTYTFHLAKNVKWHDGEPFTSADVKFTVDELIVPYYPFGAAYFSALDEVLAPDDYTVVFKLTLPFGPFMSIFEFPILPKHLYEGTDYLENEYNLNPVGTGPFKFDEWVRGDHISLVRNEDYFKQGRPFLDRIVLRVIEDPSARVRALEAGEIDYLWGYVPFADYPRLQADPNLKFTYDGNERRASIANNILFNLRQPILADPLVRKAIAHAVDKEYIVEKTALGIGNVATGPISSAIAWAHNPDVTKYPYDLERANELLDEAGYAPGADGIRFSLTFTYRITDAEQGKTGEILAEVFPQIGIDLKIEPLEMGTWTEKVFINWDFDMTAVGIGSGPDPSISAVVRYYHSTNIQKRSRYNCMGYSNPRVDELLDLAAQATDQEERAKYFYEFQEIVAEDLPVIQIRERQQAAIWRAEFGGELPAGPGEGTDNGYENVYWKKATGTSAP